MSFTGSLMRAFRNIAGNTGSTSATGPDDTLSIVGTGGVTTSVTGNTLTISASGGSVPLTVPAGTTYNIPDNTQVTTGSAILIEAGGSILLTGNSQLTWVD